MPIFKNTYYRSNNHEAEINYILGVRCLQQDNIYDANRYLKLAAGSDHTSALYNLAILNGSGLISPYDIDFAVECMQRAAVNGHLDANTCMPFLEKADTGLLGTINLAAFAASGQGGGGQVLSHLIMMAACRLYSSLCRSCNAQREVIRYELDSATYSDAEYVHAFVNRTGIQKDFFAGGSDELVPGSAADQITDGLNELYVALRQSGYDNDTCAMIRCTIVGYVILHSKYAVHSSPLLGVDRFFER